MKRRRLLWHLYPSFLVIAFAILLAVTWFAYGSFRDFYYNQIAGSLQEKAHLAEYQILSLIKSSDWSGIDKACKTLGTASSTRISVIMSDGVVTGDSEENPSAMKNHSDRPEFKDALNKGFGRSLRFSDTLGKKMMYVAIPIKENGKMLAVIRTSVPVTTIDERVSDIYRKLFWSAIFIAVCAAGISFIVSKKISRPVEEMTETAKGFATGELDRRLVIPNTTELAELAKALNEMAEELNARIKTITEETNQIQAIFSCMKEGVLAVDSSGHIVNINRAAADLLGIDAGISVKRSIEEVIRNPQIQQFIRKTLETGQAAEGHNVTLNEGDIFVQLYGTSLADDKGNRTGAIVVLHDVTRAHRLEEIRRDFVANVSHELKTPVTSIKGFVETLMDGAAKEPEQTLRFLRIVAKHTERLNAIIDDLLSLSRLEDDSEKRRLSFENTDLRSVLVSAIELSKVKAEEKNVELKLTCCEKIKVKINSAIIEQAVLNLIDNAIKYSPENSKVQVCARKVAGEVLIEVKDNGCGIEKHHLSRIFERFYVVDKGRSRKLGGTGLGLSIVKHISQVHGGYVTVESSLDEGSTFTIHLPFSDINSDKNV